MCSYPNRPAAFLHQATNIASIDLGLIACPTIVVDPISPTCPVVLRVCNAKHMSASCIILLRLSNSMVYTLLPEKECKPQ